MDSAHHERDAPATEAWTDGHAEDDKYYELAVPLGQHDRRCSEVHRSPKWSQVVGLLHGKALVDG